jgi:hypothetical protein
MNSWHSYPSIFTLGHSAISDLLDGPVCVEEKVDGSQRLSATRAAVERQHAEDFAAVEQAHAALARDYNRTVEENTTLREQLAAAQQAAREVCPAEDTEDGEAPYVCVGEEGTPIIEADDIAGVIRPMSDLWLRSQKRYEQAEARLAALSPSTPEPQTKHWGVDVRRNWENLVTIESNCLSGKPEFSEVEADVIRQCADHLHAFIGPRSTPEPQTDYTREAFERDRFDTAGPIAPEPSPATVCEWRNLPMTQGVLMADCQGEAFDYAVPATWAREFKRCPHCGLPLQLSPEPSTPNEER